MRFLVCGPYEVKRKSDKNSIDNSPAARKDFWDSCNQDFEGISSAIGVYVFAMRSGGGVTPWYVGKAELQAFRGEVLAPHKLLLYNEVVAGMSGRPQLYLLPLVTPQGKLRKKTSVPKPSVGFVETMLMGYAFRRNNEIKNKKNTRFLRELEVVGLLGGHPGAAARDLRGALGIE